MDVRLIGDNGRVWHPAADLPVLLERGQGLVWVDIPICDEEAVRVLSEVFGFHRLAVRDCVELDQFIGPGYLVTVHGPLNPVVDPELALRETHVVRQRVEEGRLRPSSFELSYAIVSALTRHQEAFVASLAEEVGVLEQRVMRNDVGDPSGSWRNCSGLATD